MILKFDDEEIKAAAAWHSGQNSMLYAVCSTGTLARGTVRPTRIPPGGGRRVSLTNAEWDRHLLDELAEELTETIESAKSRMSAGIDRSTAREAEDLAEEICTLEWMHHKVQEEITRRTLAAIEP